MYTHETLFRIQVIVKTVKLKNNISIKLINIFIKFNNRINLFLIIFMVFIEHSLYKLYNYF